jgi:ABC-2 type transport system permease protein
MFGLIAALYAVQAVLRARSEEEEGRAEAVLATGATRARWLGSHLLQALGGSAVLVVVAGLGVSATAAATSDVSPVEVLVGAVIQLPAVWVLAGVACLLVGLVPRASVVAWVAAGVAIGLWFFGALLGLGDAVLDVSPFRHVPQVPGSDLTIRPLLVLTVLALALVLTGVVGFRRRDLD